jgi:hypothetical protein
MSTMEIEKPVTALFDLEIGLDWEAPLKATGLEPGWTTVDFFECGSKGGSSTCGASGRPCRCAG